MIVFFLSFSLTISVSLPVPLITIVHKSLFIKLLKEKFPKSLLSKLQNWPLEVDAGTISHEQPKQSCDKCTDIDKLMVELDIDLISLIVFADSVDHKILSAGIHILSDKLLHGESK